MHQDKKKEYRILAIYAVGVLVVSAVIIFGGITRMDFSKYLGILAPFFYAFAFAYILNHVVKFFKRHLGYAINKLFGESN